MKSSHIIHSVHKLDKSYFRHVASGKGGGHNCLNKREYSIFFVFVAAAFRIDTVLIIMSPDVVFITIRVCIYRIYHNKSLYIPYVS